MNLHCRVSCYVGTFFIVVAAFCNALHAKPDRQDDKDKKAANFYPLQVGSQWHFKVSVGENSANAVSRITKMESFNGDDLARLEASVNNSVIAVEHLKQKEDGIYRYRNNGVEITPPLPLLKYPINIKPKEPMKWSGKMVAGADKGSYAAEATEENVEVPFGKFQAIKVVIKLEQGKGATTTYWFVKDIGFVKQTAEAGGLSIVMELEKFERGKDMP